MIRRTPDVRLFAALTIVAALLTAIGYGTYRTRRGDWTWTWREQPIAEVAPDAGHAFVARTGRPELSGAERLSPGVVLENGVAQRPGNAPRSTVRDAGEGAFLFFGDRVYFSASDNTDPRTNGRRYSFMYPPVSRRAAWVLYLFVAAVDLAALLFAGVLFRRGDLQSISVRVARGAAASLHRAITASRRPADRAAPWRAAAAWLLLVAPALLITLHALAILPLRWQRVPIAGPSHFAGFAYVTELPPRSAIVPRDTAEQLLEDGRRVPYPALPGYGSIVTAGGGRYSVVGNTIFFSATDNSDVRSNGRSYVVRRPAPVPAATIAALYLLAALATLWFGLRYFTDLLRFLGRPPLAVPLLIVVAVVAASRAWFFLDFPIVGIHPDSGSYYAVAEQIGSGVWPNFGNRPPVYPLFLHAVFAVVNRALAVAVCQTVLSLLGGLALVYAVYRRSAALAIPAALGVAAFLCNSTVLEHDTSILSESLYTSLLMLSFAGLLVGVNGRGRAPWLGAASACMALAILTRPAGMFLLGTYVLALGWLLWNRYRRVAVAAFLLPMPALLLMMSLYNAFVVRAFVPSTWAEANLAVATFLYWETDPAYPPQINDDIRRIQGIIASRFRVTGKDRRALATSWDPDVLSPLFVESFNAAALDIAQQMGGNYETTGRVWIRRIAFHSIGQHPSIYLKFVYSMLYDYFKPVPDIDFRAYLQNRAQSFYVQRHFSAARGDAFMVRLGKEFADAAPPPLVSITNPDPDAKIDLADRIVLPPTRAWRVYALTHEIRQDVFESWIWTFALFGGLIVSLVVLVRTRARDVDAFALFIVTISAVGASLVVSLVEFSQPRYSCPMEWSYNLSAVLIALVLVRRRTAVHVDTPGYVVD